MSGVFQPKWDCSPGMQTNCVRPTGTFRQIARSLGRRRSKAARARCSHDYRPRKSARATAYEAGKTVYELAAEYGCHRVTISGALKRQGVALRRTSPTAEQIDEMVRLYESGPSLARIGEQFAMNASTVLAQCARRQRR
ncbi:helix-turn-helix domain containing protein [Arthrobacter sp. MYb23]|nr:helix-turn-helix domain containing protein [Arthrobacter sp. MYb51]PRB93567.1 helix-turn-helix domain containing protein [Arthrobacter sp. MYb23]